MPLKIVKRKSKYWYLRGTVRGISVDESTGTSDAKTADAIRIQREKEILDRSVFGRSATATFLEAAVMYMEAGKEKRFVGPLLDHFGTTLLVDIDQIAIERAAKILYPGRATSTINRQVHTPISAIMRRAAKSKLCEAPMFERPKQPQGRVRWITATEADKLIENAAHHLKPILTFLFGTGARVSEAIYLNWSDVDLSRRHVTFPKTKNGEARGVPLNDRVVLALANLPSSNSGKVFRRPDGFPYKEKKEGEGGGQIKTSFGTACRRAGIKDFTPHDCRHTWASWFYIETRDLAALKELGGWKSDRMVLRYVHLNKDHLADAVNAVTWGISGERKISTKDNVRKSIC